MHVNGLPASSSLLPSTSRSLSSAWQPMMQSLPPAPPPFDLLLRILSTPPSSAAADAVSVAAALLRCQPQLRASFASLASFLSCPRAVASGGEHARMRTHSHLLLLPPHTQRSVLSLLLSLPHALHRADEAHLVWLLLEEYGAQLVEERQRGSEAGAVLPVAECDSLLLLLRAVYQRCHRILPAPLRALAQLPLPLPDLSARLNLSLALSHDSAQQASTSQPQGTAALLPVELEVWSLSAASSARLPPTALVSLLQSVCASAGADWSALVQQQHSADAFRAEDEVAYWTQQWEAERQPTTARTGPSAGELCEFDDDCYAPVHSTRERTVAAAEGDTDKTLDKRDTVMSSAEDAKQITIIATSPSDERSHDAVPPRRLSEVDEVVSAVSLMQQLLSALTALRLHDLVGVFPTGSGVSMSDEQLRVHPALLSILPLVNALQALSSSDALELAFERPSAESLSPATLPVELLYVFVRLLLTRAVNQQRATVLVRQSMRHILEGAASTLTRYTEEALIHAVTVHPHAVYQALLLPLVTPSAVQLLQPRHAQLVGVCFANNTARVDLSQHFVLSLANSLQLNAAHSPPTPSVLSSVTAIGVLVDCLQPAFHCPLSPSLVAAVLSLLCALAQLPSFAEQDKQWMTRTSNLLKRMMVDSAGLAACKERKTDLLLGWSKLKALKSKYLLAAIQAEKLEKL